MKHGRHKGTNNHPGYSRKLNAPLEIFVQVSFQDHRHHLALSSFSYFLEVLVGSTA
jgi:hypothetical protein